MENITSKEKLEDAIRFLEKKKELEEDDLKIHFNETYEQLKPINILRNTIAEFEDAPETKNEMIIASIALAVGFIAKKIIVSTSVNPIRLTIGNIVQVVISGLIIRNPEFIKRLAIRFLRFILKIKLHNKQLNLNKFSDESLSSNNLH